MARYKIFQSKYQQSTDLIWNKLANFQGYKLNEGDVIKLGRVRFRVREVKGCPDLVSNKNDAPEKQVVNTVKRIFV